MNELMEIPIPLRTDGTSAYSVAGCSEAGEA